MQALYTRTFEDFLKQYQDTAEWEEVKAMFDKFPAFTFADLDINYSVYDMFIERYDIHEIGAETDNLFFHYCREKVRENIVKYAPKMREYIQNFGKAFERQLTYTENEDTKQYLNPVNAAAGGANERVITHVITGRDRTNLIATFKTNTELLNELLNIEDIYNECLDTFNELFMQIY